MPQHDVVMSPNFIQLCLTEWMQPKALRNVGHSRVGNVLLGIKTQYVAGTWKVWECF